MTPDKRSAVMRAISKKNTRPEILVRRALHRMGLRFRLHVKDLPGTPDIVLRRHKLTILVHGCFWHQHRGCKHAKLPRSRPEYWLPKLARNVERDQQIQTELRRAGWRTAVIWECEAHDEPALQRRLQCLLRRARGSSQGPNASPRPRVRGVLPA